jgi:hypothetical protein
MSGFVRSLCCAVSIHTDVACGTGEARMPPTHHAAPSDAARERAAPCARRMRRMRGRDLWRVQCNVVDGAATRLAKVKGCLAESLRFFDWRSRSERSSAVARLSRCSAKSRRLALGRGRLPARDGATELLRHEQFGSALPFVARYPFGQHFRRRIAVIAQPPLQVRKKVARNFVVTTADLAVADRAHGYHLPRRFWWRGRSGINPCMADTGVIKRHGLRIGVLHYLRGGSYAFRLTFGSR